MDNQRLYTSSELLAATGCTRKALRVYQDKGLLQPRRDYGKRRYGAESFDRLRFIVGLREFGMSVASIRRILEARDGDVREAGPVAAQLATKVSDVVQQLTGRIEAMIQLRNELIRARETLFACSGCAEPIEACAVCASQGRLDAISRVLLVSDTTSASEAS